MDADRLETDLCSLLLRLNRRLSRQLNDELRAVMLTGEQVIMLGAIDTHPAPRVSDLKLALGLDPSTVSANLKPLMARNLVTAAADLVDRRARRLHLTEEGRTRLRFAQKVVCELDAQMKKKLEENGVLNDATMAFHILSHAP
jgi:DNA-binding MarR family transcriptional regulator